MSYKVITTETLQFRRDFFSLPKRIYQEDANYVFPIESEIWRQLDVQRNPYFQDTERKLFLVYKEGEPTARAAVIINRKHWETFGEKTAFFGFFETLEDESAVQFMFKNIEEYCCNRGADSLEGPFNPNHYNEVGILISGFHRRPSFFQTYNPEFYPRLLEKSGFQLSRKLHTRRNPEAGKFIKRVYGADSHPQTGRGYKLRRFNPHNLTGELEVLREIYNDAFSANWHFLLLTREEYLFSAKFLKLVTYPDLIAIVEKNQEPVAVLQCVLDINPLLQKFKGRITPWGYINFLLGKRRIDNLIIYALGIKKAHRGSYAFKLLMTAMCEMVAKYHSLETTWMSEDNIMAIRAAELFGLEPDRWFAIYKKSSTK